MFRFDPRSAFHNIVAHPLMEVLHWIGLDGIGMWIHDSTTPE